MNGICLIFRGNYIKHFIQPEVLYTVCWLGLVRRQIVLMCKKELLKCMFNDTNGILHFYVVNTYNKYSVNQ